MATEQSSNEDYSPPAGSELLAKQDEPDALRLLIAQRELYSKSKRWLGLRLIGMGVIGVAAPVVTLLWQPTAVVIGAIAGTWIFLGRTAFIVLEKRLSARAAAVQEMYDLKVFGMSDLGDRNPSPSLEDITNLAGADEDIMKVAKQEKLLGWYSINAEDNGFTSIAICQRTNAAYSSDLLRTMAKTWLAAIGVWIVILIALSIFLKFTLSTFLLGVFLPLLPAFLDTFEYWKGIKRASADRATIGQDIQKKIEANEVSSEDLLIWQSRMYELRRDTPQVPDFLYKVVRNGNERTMESVARQLSNAARRNRKK